MEETPELRPVPHPSAALFLRHVDSWVTGGMRPSGRRRSCREKLGGPRDGYGPGTGRGGSLLELELPGLLVLRLLQVLPHTDVLVMLVLDLRLHRLQLGVELGGGRCSSEATQAQGPGLSTG